MSCPRYIPSPHLRTYGFPCKFLSDTLAQIPTFFSCQELWPLPPQHGVTSVLCLELQLLLLQSGKLTLCKGQRNHRLLSWVSLFLRSWNLIQLFVHCLVTVLHVLCQFYTCFQAWIPSVISALKSQRPASILRPLEFPLEHKCSQTFHPFSERENRRNKASSCCLRLGFVSWRRGRLFHEQVLFLVAVHSSLDRWPGEYRIEPRDTFCMGELVSLTCKCAAANRSQDLGLSHVCGRWGSWFCTSDSAMSYDQVPCYIAPSWYVCLFICGGRGVNLGLRERWAHREAVWGHTQRPGL